MNTAKQSAQSESVNLDPKAIKAQIEALRAQLRETKNQPRVVVTEYNGKPMASIFVGDDTKYARLTMGIDKVRMVLKLVQDLENFSKEYPQLLAEMQGK